MELARCSGLTNNQISKMERKSTASSLANIEALSIALECEEVHLLWCGKENDHP
jgi:transcriptional regulator with XRE-family HTH domain